MPKTINVLRTILALALGTTLGVGCATRTTISPATVSPPHRANARHARAIIVEGTTGNTVSVGVNQLRLALTGDELRSALIDGGYAREVLVTREMPASSTTVPVLEFDSRIQGGIRVGRMVANSILGGVTLTLALPFLWNKYDLDIRARVTVYQNGKPTGEIRKRATGVLDYKLFGMMSLAPLEELSTQTEASVLSQIVAELLEEQTAETNGM